MAGRLDPGVRDLIPGLLADMQPMQRVCFFMPDGSLRQSELPCPEGGPPSFLRMEEGTQQGWPPSSGIASVFTLPHVKAADAILRPVGGYCRAYQDDGRVVGPDVEGLRAQDVYEAGLIADHLRTQRRKGLV